MGQPSQVRFGRLKSPSITRWLAQGFSEWFDGDAAVLIVCTGCLKHSLFNGTIPRGGPPPA